MNNYIDSYELDQKDIKALCENSSLKDVLTHISSEIDLFADGAEQADDITMLVMKMN